MKKSSLRTLQMIAAFSMVSQPFDQIPTTINIRSKEKPVPKGAKRYLFNTNGEFSTETMLKSEVVFKCIAISDERAIKKYNKWKTKNKNNDL